MSALGIGPAFDAPNDSQFRTSSPRAAECSVRDISSGPSSRLRREEELQRELARNRHPSVRARQMASTTTSAHSLSHVLYKTFAFLLGTLFLVATGMWLGISLRPAAYVGDTLHHSVAAGESLWSIASGVDALRPLEDVVYDIRSLNNLVDDTLHPGQSLVLPVD